MFLATPGKRPWPINTANTNAIGRTSGPNPNQTHQSMAQIRNKTRTALSTKIAFLIFVSVFSPWLGSGCKSVEPARTDASARTVPTNAPTTSTAAAPSQKRSDFNSIMSRMEKTSHSGDRKPAQDSVQQASTSTQKRQSGPGSASLAKATEAPKPSFSELPALTATTPTPLTPRSASAQVAQSPLIVTNQVSQPEPQSVATTVMTVKARGTNDDDEGDEPSTHSAGVGPRTLEDSPTGEGDGHWLRRGILSVSVGCLGVGCFLLRMIRLGRFAGRLVSEGVQVATKLRV